MEYYVRQYYNRNIQERSCLVEATAYLHRSYQAEQWLNYLEGAILKELTDP